MKTDNNELFDTYIRPQLRYIRNICRMFCRDKSCCEEYYNEILTTLFLSMHTYNPELHIRAWLYVIIKREVARKQIRRSRHKDVITYADLEQPYYQNISSCEDSSPETHNDLYHAISILAPVAKRIIEMRLQGYLIREISKALFQEGIIKADSINIVKCHIREAYY